MEGYGDGRVACTDQEIVIRHYYPLGAKHIKYQDIRKVLVAPLGGWASGASTAAELW